MSVGNLIEEGQKLFEAKKYLEAIQKLSEALSVISDATTQIQQKNYTDLDKAGQTLQHFNAHFLLMYCYLEQASQTKNLSLFDQAIKHAQEQLKLAKQLGDEEGIQQQFYAIAWLGRCYFARTMEAPNTALFDQAIEQAYDYLECAQELGEEERIKHQDYAQFLLGRLYFEQAMQTKNASLFDQAIEQYQEIVSPTEQVNRVQQIHSQVYAQNWLGLCYLEKAIQTKDISLIDQAIQHFQQALDLAEQLGEEDGAQEQVRAEFRLGRCYLQIATEQERTTVKQANIDSSREHFRQALDALGNVGDEEFKNQLHLKVMQSLREVDFCIKQYENYFTSKQTEIQGKLPSELDNKLKEAVAAILAVLSISPIEFDKPLAHYTSPNVCEKLLGIQQRQAKESEIEVSSMRMNSSTYMNDPYEGKSLADYLGMQELSLENQTDFGEYNAFFACFSARVNDLNQFRLYGKIDNVEASGCCLVFNKDGNWIQEPDILASYHRLSKMSELGNIAGTDSPTAQLQPSENLPLYQIAYIFYRDEYTSLDEYDVFAEQEDTHFGVRLKPISDNEEWHKLREKKLRDALIKLQQYFQAEKGKEQDPNSQFALEYIRYLFKDYAFRDEEEFRLLQIEALGSDKVQYCPVTNSAYLEYGDICSRLDEVILGTNYERTGEERKVEVFRHLLKKKWPAIKVSHSSLPINAGLAVRKS